jgi:hypothetical protein
LPEGTLYAISTAGLDPVDNTFFGNWDFGVVKTGAATFTLDLNQNPYLGS